MAKSGFRIWGRQFVPAFWPTFITVCLLAVLVGLGCWQVQRLHWKENLIAELAARQKQSPVDIGTLFLQAKLHQQVQFAQVIARNNFVPVFAEVEILPLPPLYVTAISPEGAGGYRVFQVVAQKDGNAFFLDQGFIPYSGLEAFDRSVKDSFGFDVGQQHPLKQHVQGVLRVAERAVYWWQALADRQSGQPQLQSQPQPQSQLQSEYNAALASVGWRLQAAQRVRTEIDLDQMAAQLGLRQGNWLCYLQRTVKEKAQDMPILLPATPQLVNNHFGYALTWFFLALAILVIYGISSFHNESE